MAVGAVSEDVEILDSEVQVSSEYIIKEIHRIRKELKRRREAYSEKKTSTLLLDKIVIVIDDGAATGFTLLSTIRLIDKLGPKQIVIALPVASPLAIQRLKNQTSVDQIICLHTPDDFQAVGNYYQDFRQLEDSDVMEILKSDLA